MNKCIVFPSLYNHVYVMICKFIYVLLICHSFLYINFLFLYRQNLLQSLCSYDSFIPEPSAEPDCVSASAEDVGCGCNPEAEIEPEVEIGTEADLAEADQSPGQQGTVSDNLPATENWSIDQESVLSRNASSASAVTLNGDDSKDVEDSSEGATGTQVRMLKSYIIISFSGVYI